MVMNAFLIAFAVTGGGKLAHPPHQLFRLQQEVVQLGHVQPVAPGLAGGQHFAGQVLGTVKLVGFRLQVHLPEGFERLQLRVLQGLEEVGAGQMQVQLIAPGHQRQVQLLGVDAEAMPRPKTDDIAAFLEQLGLVAQAAYSLVPGMLETGFDIVSLDVILQPAQPLGQLAELENQRIGGEEGVHLLRGLQPPGTARQAVDDAHGCIKQVLRAALTLIQQGLSMAFKGFQQLFALGQDIAEKRLVIAELAFQLLQLHQQARQLCVAPLRIPGLGQGAGNALTEQAELRSELCYLLGRPHAAPALFGTGLGLIEPGVDLGNGLDDAGTLGGILDLQRGHQRGQHVQVG